MKTMEELLKEIPPEFHSKILDFARSLMKEQRRGNGMKLRQDWAGALRDHSDRYTSLGLQKKSLEWRGD